MYSDLTHLLLRPSDGQTFPYALWEELPTIRQQRRTAARAVRAVRSAHGAPACQPCASILIVLAYPLHREFEALLVSAFGHQVEEWVSAVQRLPVPKSSECPAFRRDSP
jgi:hypothetical protein